MGTEVYLTAAQWDMIEAAIVLLKSVSVLLVVGLAVLIFLGGAALMRRYG